MRDLVLRPSEGEPSGEHIKQTLLSMRPGRPAGQACSCGWHSHTQTFEEHLVGRQG